MFRPACILLRFVVAVFTVIPPDIRMQLPPHRALLLLIPLVLSASSAASTCPAPEATIPAGPGDISTLIHPVADTILKKEKSTGCAVLVSGNTVSLFAERAAIDDILGEIGRKKQFKLFISPKFTPYKVTEQFHDIPLEKALEILMKGSSYSLVYGDSASPESIQELHVLPSRPLPGLQQAAKATVAGASRAELLYGLETSALPESMKRALRQDAAGNEAATEQVLNNRTEVIRQLIRKLESSGAGNSAILRQLRKQSVEREQE